MNPEEIAKILLRIRAVELRPDNPFTYSSGLKSPIYTDNRLLMSYPPARRKIVSALKEVIEDNNWEPDVIAGVATGAIPHAAWLSEELNRPMIYIRGKAKEHGRQNQIEGKLNPEQTVVIIEDLISTGRSSAEAAEAVLAAGARIAGLAAIFSYELAEAEDILGKLGFPVVSLTDVSKLTQVAVKHNYISEKDRLMILEWQKSPEDWQ